MSIKLPAPHQRRKIIIKVVNADGKPVGENLLQISYQKGLVRNLEGKNHNATVDFDGYQERTYYFEARYWIDNLLRNDTPTFDKRISKSEVVKVLPGKDDAVITLVLGKVVLSRDDP